MLTKEKIILYLEQQAMRPLSGTELAEQLGADTVEKIEQLKKLLCEMETEGTLVLSRKNRYGTLKQFHLLVGTIRRHPKGFGFLMQEHSEADDIFIPATGLNGAMNGDRAIVRIRREATGQSRAEGEVTRILQRNVQQIVGTFESSRHFGFVVPDDKRFGSDIFVSKDNFNGAKNNMKVLVEITKWPQKNQSAEGKIIQVIGKKNTPGVDILSVILSYGLPQQFPIDVLMYAESLADTISAEEIEKRRDLRHLLMVTIDGDDAKDLDDAVSVERLENGHYMLGVHIADVGHYVVEDNVLDKEALERATSIYLVDRVIPMLPQKLSNELCSLNAGKDRLTLSCMMEVDLQGNVVSHEIFESIICVDYRMTYKNVSKMLVEQNEDLCRCYAEIVPMLRCMEQLQKILEEKRKMRGAIAFHTSETKVVLDKKGHPIRIEYLEQGIANKIIEEFMLCANETVAEHYFWLDVPFLYRVHEEPKTDDILDVNKFLRIFGYNIKGVNNSIHSKAYQNVIENISGKPEEMVVNTVLLRSMQHARYDTEPLGHFGLAAQYYSHFTSPIRRYPDLAIHRVIKELLHNGDHLDENRVEKLKGKMRYYAEHSSAREKIAEEVERKSVDLKKIEYMSAFVGEKYLAKISGVTNFGLFVQLKNSVEGLVHISTLIDDFYQFFPEQYALIGERTHKVYQIGQEVEVQLVRTSIEDCQIDFEVTK